MRAYRYLAQGASLALAKGNRRFVLLPLFANCLLLAVSLHWGLQQLEASTTAITEWLPSWLEWLSYIIKPLFVTALIVVFFMTFSTVANFIAAPFYGFLSQNVVNQLRPDIEEPPGGLSAFLKSIPESLLRELAKVNYYLPRALALWLLSFFIPGINIVVWFIFNAWMMNLQYLDYPIDNQNQPFKVVRQTAAEDKAYSFSFGGMVLLASMIPILNLLIMPAAVCGASRYWCDQQPSN